MEQPQKHNRRKVVIPQGFNGHVTRSIFAEIAGYGVVPVIAIESVEAALPVADALLEGGLPVVEITFRTAAAAAVIDQIADIGR